MANNENALPVKAPQCAAGWDNRDKQILTTGIQKNEEERETDKITRKRTNPYGIVPFALLEYRALPPLTRLVATWIESKPEGWLVRPAVLQSALGITEKQWLTARRRMIEAGIFSHKKYRKPDGKWVWKSEFDATPILGATPPLAMHGRRENIEVREKELRNRSKPTAEGLGTAVPTPRLPQIPLRITANVTELDELKKLHMGFVLTDLGVEWREAGKYLYWDEKSRGRLADDGHWLFAKVDTKGDIENCGSSIDLIVAETGCLEREAISRLQRIYDEIASAPHNSQRS